MSEKELSEILAEMYKNAQKGEYVAMIHLFGIKYADELSKFSVKEIVINSGLHSSYVTEVSKGIKLARYVNVK